jgi:hypothetical protein
MMYVPIHIIQSGPTSKEIARSHNHSAGASDRIVGVLAASRDARHDLDLDLDLSKVIQWQWRGPQPQKRTSNIEHATPHIW